MNVLPSTIEAVVIANLSLGMVATLVVVYYRLRRDPFLSWFAAFWAAQAILFGGHLVQSWMSGESGSAGQGYWHLFPLVVVGVLQPLFLGLSAISLSERPLNAPRLGVLAVAAAAVWALALAGSAPLFGLNLSPMERLQFGRAVLNGLGFAAFSIAFRCCRASSSRVTLILTLLPSVTYSIHFFVLALALAGLVPAYLNYSYLAGTCLPVGVVLGVVLTVVDEAIVAQRARADADLRFRILLENIPLSGLMLDANGQAQFCNHHLAGLLDASPEKLLGTNWIENHVAPESRAAARQSLAAQLAARQTSPLSEEVIQDAHGNTRLICWTNILVPSGTPDQTVLARIGFDVTEQRLREQSLAEAQRLESLGRLAGGLAHDLNNYLTVINGYAQLVCESGDTPESTRQRVDRILTAGQQGAGLIRQLLAFSRRQVIQPGVLGLNEQITQSQSMLRQLVPVNVELRFDLRAEPDTVCIDASQLHQLLLNLVTNARDAIEGPGWVMVESATAEFDAAASTRKGHPQPGRHVVLVVTDSGHGMDAETKARVFEPFFTTKPMGSGTGLGLATVYGIVRNAGGTVSVYTEPGHGSTFKVYLPLSAASQCTAAPAVESASTSGTEHIIVVDDHDDVRKFMRETLQGAGYRILVAATPREALDRVKTTGLEPALLITDVILPEMSGVELAQQLASRFPALAVLYVSGYTPNVIVKQGILKPGFSYLAKPFSPADLLKKTRAMLDSKPR
ncbi:MAG: ATP-binding protein [Bryobacteraceae bacterium]